MDDFFGFGDNVPTDAGAAFDPFAQQATIPTGTAEDMFGFGDAPAEPMYNPPPESSSFFPVAPEPVVQPAPVMITMQDMQPAPVVPAAALPMVAFTAPTITPVEVLPPPQMASTIQAFSTTQPTQPTIGPVPTMHQVPVTINAHAHPDPLPPTLAPYAPLPPAIPLSSEYEAALNDPEILVAYQRDNSIAKANEIKYRAFQNLQDKNHEAAKALIYQQSQEYREAYMEKFRKECEARKAHQSVKREKVRRALLEGDSVAWARIRSLVRTDSIGTDQALRQLEAIKAKSAFDYRAHELLNK